LGSESSECEDECKCEGEEEMPKAADAPDRMYLAQKLRILLRRTKEESIIDRVMFFIDWPLTLLRNYTIPSVEEDGWDRTRAALAPMFMPLCFWICFGDAFGCFKRVDCDDDYNKTKYGAKCEGDDPEMEGKFDLMDLLIPVLWMIPGGIIGLVIRFRTKENKGPSWLMTFYAIIGFIMSIAWINITSEFVVGMLNLFAIVSGIPFPLLQFTVLAWGNCLGDMAADVAMTKKGFGEMAITATVAGPVFNILVGLTLSNYSSYLKNTSVK